MSDAEIVKRVALRDSDAERCLAHRCYEVLGPALRKITADTELRKDLQQEAFCVVLTRLRNQELRDDGRLAGYIYRTALFLFYGEIRKYRSRLIPMNDLQNDQLLTCNDDATTTLHAREVRHAINTALENLKIERDRELLRRFYLYGEDKKVVASFLNLSTLHFDRVHFRCKARMRDAVAKTRLVQGIEYELE